MRRTTYAFCLCALLLVLLQITPTTFAQEATGKIIGTVTDQQGAVVPGVTITVINEATSISSKTTTDKDGIYQVLHLNVGQYKITASKAGFQNISTKAYPLEINQSLRVDLQLTVGTTTETVEVNANAAVVEAYNSTIGTSVTERPIINLPLNGRNVLDLAKLEPGVADKNPGGGDQAGDFSIAGSRTDSVTYLLDGGNNNNLLNNGVVFNPNPDTVAEFRVLESNYSAEYGRNAGGIVSTVTKSGGNQFHGSGFEFLRNNAFNANTFFNKLNAQVNPGPLLVDPHYYDTPVLKRNQYGGTIGGPIKKNKIFFFAGYQGQKLTEQQTVGPLSSSFTPKTLLNGDFSGMPQEAGVVSFLEANPWFIAPGHVASDAVIDPAKFDPVAKNYLNAGLIPMSADGTLISKGNYVDNYNQIWTKFDFNFTENDKLTASLGWQNEPMTRPFAGGATSPFPVNDKNTKYYLSLAYNKTLSPTMLNEARLTAQRDNLAQGYPAVHLPTSMELGINNTPDLATGPAILWFLDSGALSGFSFRGPLDKINNTFGYTDTLSWVKGRHTLKFGGGFMPYQNNTIYAYEVNGEFDFYGHETYVGTGNETADFLLGLPDEYIQFGNAPSNIRSKSWFVFGHDEWRVTRSLVLNFGLRYEYSSPKADTQGRSFSIMPGHQSTRFINAPPGLVFPGDAGAPTGANFPDHNDFAPRIGFAWSPFNNNKTSIRGGFGVFYDILKGEDNLQFNGQAPWFGFADITDYYYPTDLTGPTGYLQEPYASLGYPNPFPSQPPPPDVDFDASGFLPFGGGGVYFVQPNLRTPYIYQYNLSWQQELARNILFQIAYVGSTGHKLTSLVDANPFIMGTTNRILNTQPGADIYSTAAYSYADEFRNAVNQSYNALQTSLKKQLTGRDSWFGSTYFTMAYTWSKNIDNASGFRNNSSYVSAYKPNVSRGPADMDVGQMFVFSGGWDLPFQNSWKSGPKALTKGWSLYPIITWRTGFPIDIRGWLPRNRRTPGPSGAGDSNQVRPNLAGNSITYANPYSNMNGDGVLWVPLENFDVSAASYGCDPSWSASECEDNFNARYVVPYSPSYGTMGRNMVRGPHRTNVDFAVAKTTPLFTEKLNMELRGEFFNLFNHTQFVNPDSDHMDPYSPSAFGRITETYEPRVIQLSVRLIF